MQIQPYLSFRGDCEEAFGFYERNLGGELGPLFRYGGSPMADQVPPEWADKIMHGSVRVGGLLLQGADVDPDQFEELKGFSLSIHLRSSSDAERVFSALAEGGRVVMPLEKTFWAARFGVLVDRFGISWMINCDGSDAGP